MTNLSNSNPLDDIYDLLTSHRKIAVIWGIEDVLYVRPDLTEGQAWTVLLDCKCRLDGNYGRSRDIFEDVAASLLPAPVALVADEVEEP